VQNARVRLFALVGRRGTLPTATVATILL